MQTAGSVVLFLNLHELLSTTNRIANVIKKIEFIFRTIKTMQKDQSSKFEATTYKKVKKTINRNRKKCFIQTSVCFGKLNIDI